MEKNLQTTNNSENKNMKKVSIDDFRKMDKQTHLVAIPMKWMLEMSYLSYNWSYSVSADGLSCTITGISVWLVSELIEHFKEGFRFGGNSWDVLVVIMGPLNNTIRLKVNPLQTDNKMNIRYKVNERNERNERNEKK